MARAFLERLCIFYLTKELEISTSNYRINERIRAKEVRLIDATGENVGVVSFTDAMNMAIEADLDLVEVAPNANPPVCRIIDYGKFIYERNKKEKEARRAQKKIEIKEIRMRPKTTDHHRGFKVRDARRWLLEGKKVKVIKTITSVNGALHEGEIILVERRENGHWRCRDNMGRIFYLEESNLKIIKK